MWTWLQSHDLRDGAQDPIERFRIVYSYAVKRLSIGEESHERTQTIAAVFGAAEKGVTLYLEDDSASDFVFV